MSITDELREYADRLSDEAARKSEHGFSPVAMKLEGIADRIDAEHEKAEQDLIDANNQMEQLCECSIRLPVDADGVPIHIGAVMEWCDSGETLTVEGIGRDVLFYIADGETAEWTAARNKRHHHEPTVEDVLQKLLEQAVGYSDAHTTVALNAIAEYAAKLRLAEGVE